MTDVQRYDIAVDLTALPEGPEVRCTSISAARTSASAWVRLRISIGDLLGLEHTLGVTVASQA